MPLNDLISKAKNSKLYSTISKVVSTIDRDKERDGFQFISPQTRQNISQATQRVQQSGVLNPFNQLKGFSQALAPSNYGQTTKELFTPLLGEQKAGQLGYGLQGATQLTPSYGLNMLSSDYRQSVQQPQTQQEKDAQQIGRATYGLALTAPLGGANMARNVLARAFTGIGAGAGIGGAITAVTGGDIKQGVKQGAMSGYSFAPIGAITNPITSKILAGAPTLLQNQIGQRAIGGVANVIEDEIQALVDGYDTDTQSRVTSLLIGAALTGNKDAWAITKRKLNSLNVKNADELIKFSKTRLTEAYKDQGAVRLSWSEPDGSRRAVTVDKATQPGWIMYLNNRGVDYRLNFIKGSLGSVGGAPKPPTDPLEAKNLIAQHNIKPQGVLHGEKIGGLPLPSIAISRTEYPLENFGDISLLGKSDLVDPKIRGNKVFNADAYTPRYPTINYSYKSKEAEQTLEPILNEVEAYFKGNRDAVSPHLGNYGGKYRAVLEGGDFENKGRDSLENSREIKAYFAKKKGVAPNADYKAINLIVENNNSEYQKFVDDLMSNILDKESLFQGFTYSGNRRYKPHTLENVVKVMKSSMKDGEGFNYGLGSVRASVAKKYNTLSGIKADRDKIMSTKDFEKLRSKLDAEWESLLYESYKSNSPSSFADVLIGGIKNKTLESDLKEFGFGYMDTNKIKSFLEKLHNAPTEYFEVKPQRAVGLNEFQVAVTPKDTPQNVIESLKRQGVKIYTYGENERAAVIKKAAEENNLAFGAVAGLEPYQDEDGNWKYRFNPTKAAIGIGVAGGLKAVKNADIKPNQSQPKIPVKPIDRTQLTGKALSTPNEVLIKGKSQPELPAGKTQSEKELLGYEKGLTSSLQEQKLAQQGVGVKLKTQEPKKVLITTKSTQTPNQKLEAVRQAKAKSVKANQSDLPSIENTIRSSNLDVKSKVNILDYWLRTPDKVLRKIGLGKEAESIKTAYNNYLDELPKEINKVTEWYKRVGSSDEASQRIFKYLDGQDQKLTVEELKVATEIKSYLNKWADRLGLPQSGRIANYITHIFEQDFIQKEFDPELAKIIQDKVPGSVYDPFLQQRLGKLGYIEDAFRALDAYVKRATRKANMDPALSQLQEVSGKLDIDSWNYVKNYADRINLRPTDTDNLFDNLIKSSPVGYKLGQRPVARISRGVRQMVYRGTLGLNIGSAIRNLTQGVNTYAQLGEKYTAQGYLKAIQSIASKSDELERVGVLRNSFIEDRGLSATKKFWENLDKGLFYFFEMVEKINRGSAYYGAKSKALAQGLSEEQAVKAGVDMARKTQFTFGSVDTPVNLQSDIVKLLTQFQSFNVKQTEFLSDMAKNKEYAGMIRWLGANAVVLFTVGQAMGWDWKDMIPFGGVADGQSPIGSSPAMTLAKDVGKIALGETDKYGNPLKPVQLAKDLIPLIPGGVQINKTIGGLKDVSRGYDESTTGRVKFPIAQTPRNYIQGAVLGSYNLPEAKEYRKMEASVLGEKQSESYKTILTTQGKEAATNFYNGILKKRGMDVKLQPGESSDDMVVIKSKFDNTPELLTNDEIVTYYESKITKPKTGNKYEKAIYEKEIWSKASDINSRESLTQEQKDGAITKLLSNIGVSKEDYDYYEVAKQEVDLKTLRVYDVYDQTKDYDEFMKYLVNGRKPVNGKILISDGVIDNLVDDGLIPYALGKDLKSIDLNEDGSVKTGKIRAKSSKAKTDSIKAYSNALERLGDSLLKVNIKAPTVTSTSTNKINTKGLTFSSAGL